VNRYSRFLLAAIGVLIAPAVIAATEVPDSILVRTGMLPLISSEQVDVTGYNKKIFAALAVGELWPTEPMELATHLLGHGEEARLRGMTRWYQEGENPTSTTVNVLWDGLRDDSVRGIWHQLELKRSDHGNWRVVEMRRAYRCWRGCNQERFSERACP
jgi:hypothetical protein